MRFIKVFLQRPWKFSDSPYYEYLTSNTSQNIQYVNIAGKNQGIANNISKFKFQNKIKYVAKHIIRRLFPSLPNAITTKNNKEFDIIHCAHCLSLNKTPWVVDIEWPAQFWAGRKVLTNHRKKILKLLLGKNCKKIISWTDWSKQEVLEVFPEVKNKITTLYPALKSVKVKRDYKKIRLLFVSRRFYFKGGLHALEVMDRLTKKYEFVEGVFISDVPEEITNKYSRNKKIKFYSFVQKEKMMKEIYPNSDIMIYPSYTDTFGFAMLEALSFGIPVVTVDGQSRKEIINNGKTGFVIKRPENIDYTTLINQESTLSKINEMAEKLIENRSVLREMSKNCYNEVDKGKFSIAKRNEKILQIYEESIN